MAKNERKISEEDIEYLRHDFEFIVTDEELQREVLKKFLQLDLADLFTDVGKLPPLRITYLDARSIINGKYRNILEGFSNSWNIGKKENLYKPVIADYLYKANGNTGKYMKLLEDSIIAFYKTYGEDRGKKEWTIIWYDILDNKLSK